MWKYALPIAFGVLLVAAAWLLDRRSEGKPANIPWLLQAFGVGLLLALAFVAAVALL